MVGNWKVLLLALFHVAAPQENVISWWAYDQTHTETKRRMKIKRHQIIIEFLYEIRYYICSSKLKFEAWIPLELSECNIAPFPLILTTYADQGTQERSRATI